MTEAELIKLALKYYLKNNLENHKYLMMMINDFVVFIQAVFNPYYIISIIFIQLIVLNYSFILTLKSYYYLFY